MRYFIGVDVGGTTSTICVGNEDAKCCTSRNNSKLARMKVPGATVSAIVAQAAVAIGQVGAVDRRRRGGRIWPRRDRRHPTASC